jgi:hypothetical protein
VTLAIPHRIKQYLVAADLGSGGFYDFTFELFRALLKLINTPDHAPYRL